MLGGLNLKVQSFVIRFRDSHWNFVGPYPYKQKENINIVNTESKWLQTLLSWTFPWNIKLQWASIPDTSIILTIFPFLYSCSSFDNLYIKVVFIFFLYLNCYINFDIILTYLYIRFIYLFYIYIIFYIILYYIIF